ncbi:unnamed protein product [Closterium sp. NIES-54]
MFITLYFIVTRLPDSLRASRDHFLALDPTVLTVDLLEQHLLAAETSVVAVGAARGTPRTPFFEGCSPFSLAPSYASAAAADVLGVEDVGAASASGKRRSSKGKGGRGGGGGNWGGGGGSSGGGGGSRGGGASGSGGGSGGVGGGGGGRGGGGGNCGSGSGGGRAGATQRGGSGGGQRQQQQRRSETPSPQQLREWFSQRGASGGSGSCPYAELLRSGAAIFDLDHDAILAAMYALSVSAEGDCYLCVPPDPGIEAAALGASESALPDTTPAEALHTITLDSGASRCFFRDSTTPNPLSAPVPVRLADPSGGPNLARSSTVLPCPAVPSGSLSGLHLPLFSTNLVSTAALEDAMVTTTTPGGQRVLICTCTRTGRHLATFTRRPGSSLYTLATEPPLVAASAQVSASGQVAPPCSCHLLTHQTLLWHHRLGHPSLPRLRGMHSRLLVYGLPRSLPPLPLSPAPRWLPCIEGRQRATPHSSSFPPTTAPLQTLHMDRFREELPVLRLHSDRGGEFSSDLLRDFCRGEGILHSFTLPDSPQQNGIAERRIGLVMEVARTSMIHVAAPHFLWPFAVRYAAQQFNLWPRVSLPETSPTLRWTGEVGDASVFRDLTFDESVPFYRLFPYRSAPPPPPPLFLAPGPPLVDPLPPQGPAPSGAARGAASGVAASGGAEHRGAEPRGAEPGGAESEGAGSRGAEPADVEHGGAESRGAEPRGAASSGAPVVAGAGDSATGDTGARGASATARAGGTGGAAVASPGGARTRGTGAAGTGLVGSARGGDPTEPGAARARCARSGGTSAGGAGAGGVGAGGAGAGSFGAGGAGAGGAGAVDHGARGAGARVAGGTGAQGTTGGLTEHREPASRPASPVCTGHRVPCSRPPPVPGTHAMALRPSSVPLRIPRPAPPESSLPAVPDLESDRARAASPTVSRLFATVVTDPSFESTAASALVAELVHFVAACRVDYATAFVAHSESVSPPSVEVASSHGCRDGIVEVHIHLHRGGSPPGANIVDDMWIFGVKRPPGSPPAFKARYVARGFSQREGVDYFHTFSPIPKMTTLRVLLHVAAQRDYELHSPDFTTAFLQGNLHKEIWMRRPSGFTGSFLAGTQWSLRRPIYGLRQAPREWYDTKRTTLATLGFAPSTADPSLFLRTDTSLPPFYVLVYLDDLVVATADTEALTLVKSELQKRHTCIDLGELRSYLGLQITRDRARRIIRLTHSHMVHQVLQRFGFQLSSPQPTPLSTSHSLSAPPSDESVEPSGPYSELVGCLMALRYLCSTSGMGLVLGGRDPDVLTGHADASWELRWLTYLLSDLGEQPRSPPVLYVDNKAMIVLCKEHILEHRMKHIALRYFLAQELQQPGQFRLAYVATRANTADIFTKALPPGDHQHFYTVLSLVPTLPHLLTA